MTLQASVIVNTHNRPDYLDGCLRALAQQSIPHADYEIIVVDNSAAKYTDAIAVWWATLRSKTRI